MAKSGLNLENFSRYIIRGKEAAGSSLYVMTRSSWRPYTLSLAARGAGWLALWSCTGVTGLWSASTIAHVTQIAWNGLRNTSPVNAQESCTFVAVPDLHHV